jgi:Zn-dependent M28 family amino/carboxypeptidase
VIGVVPGTELPEEVVVVSGHLDSWDVGQGAQDDGVGCVLAMEAGRLVRHLGLRPRRTIRVVLFANEENGTRGGLGYLETHRGALERHAAAIESDIGNGLIKAFTLELHDPKAGPKVDRERALALFRRHLSPWLEPLGVTRFDAGGSGVDVGPMVRDGVPGVGAGHDTARYWDVHHSRADTFDKVVKEDLQKNAATLAVATYLLADMPERLVARP